MNDFERYSRFALEKTALDNGAATHIVPALRYTDPAAAQRRTGASKPASSRQSPGVRVLMLLLLLLSLPISLPLALLALLLWLMAVIALSLLGLGLLTLVLGSACGLLFTGVWLMLMAPGAISTGPLLPLLGLGIGLILAGLGLLALILAVSFCVWLLPPWCRTIRGLALLPFRKRGGCR